MPETLVICGGLPTPKHGRKPAIRLDASANAPAEERIEINLEPVVRQFADAPPPVVLDLLELASYVYVADRLVRRETTNMGDMGSHWRRQFHFHVPVRRPDVWTRPSVIECLGVLLGFLSDDDFEFTFAAAQGERLIVQRSLGIAGREIQKNRPDAVMLFSGGLDSLAGAAELIFGSNRRVVLVTHQSSTAIAHRQNTVAAALKHRAPPESVIYAPIWVRKGDQDPIEHTQRLRSFLFAALGISLAVLAKLPQLLFFENGITSFNLPVAEYVIGARASRTTHPRVLRGLEQLAKLLLGDSFGIENRFLWKTKAEAVANLPALGCDDLIAETTSCANVRFLSMHQRQCGFCSQCVERRVALLAAGLGKYEAGDSYFVDLFNGPYRSGNEAAMARHCVSRAERLANLSQTAFFALHGQVFRTLSSLPGSAKENSARIHDLHRRYGKSVVAVIDEALRAKANLDALIGGLDERSLFAVLGREPFERELADPSEDEESASAQAASAKPVREVRLLIALDPENLAIELDGGARIVGPRPYALISALATQLREDESHIKERGRFTYVGGRQLAKALELTEGALRQLVLRSRERIAAALAKAIGYDIDEEDVIQSRRWGGYRLNPYVVLVDSKQLRRKTSAQRDDTNQAA